MDYNKIYEDSKKELEQLKVKNALLTEKIKSLSEKLGLDSSSPIEPQIEALEAKLLKEKEEKSAKLEELIDQYNKLVENE